MCGPMLCAIVDASGEPNADLRAWHRQVGDTLARLHPRCPPGHPRGDRGAHQVPAGDTGASPRSRPLVLPQLRLIYTLEAQPTRPWLPRSGQHCGGALTALGPEELRSLLGDRLLVLDDELMVDDHEHQLARLWDFLALPAVSVASQEPKRSSRDGWRGAASPATRWSASRESPGSVHQEPEAGPGGQPGPAPSALLEG